MELYSLLMHLWVCLFGLWAGFRSLTDSHRVLIHVLVVTNLRVAPLPQWPNLELKNQTPRLNHTATRSLYIDYYYIYFAKLNPSCNSNSTELTLLCSSPGYIFFKTTNIFPQVLTEGTNVVPQFFFLSLKIRAQKH